MTTTNLDTGYEYLKKLHATAQLVIALGVTSPFVGYGAGQIVSALGEEPPCVDHLVTVTEPLPELGPCDSLTYVLNDLPSANQERCDVLGGRLVNERRCVLSRR
jgi:hypothetical protein